MTGRKPLCIGVQITAVTSASLRSSIHSLRIRMTSYPCNKYEQITPSYRLSVNDWYCYIAKGRTIIFSRGGYRDFQEAGNFFLPSIDWALTNFFPPLIVQTIFLKIPQISHNRGGLSRQSFFRCTSGADNLFQQFFSCRKCFPNRDTLRGKNNGPSLSKRWRSSG